MNRVFATDSLSQKNKRIGIHPECAFIPNPFGATYPFVLDSYTKGKIPESPQRLDIL